MAIAEHFRDRSETTLEVFKCEAVLAFGAEDREDQQAVQIELQDIRFPVATAVQGGRLLEDTCVRSCRLDSPLAGCDHFQQSADDAVRVVLIVDSADDRAVPAGQHIPQQALSPLDADVAAADVGITRIACGKDDDAVAAAVGLHQAISIAGIEAGTLRLGFGGHDRGLHRTGCDT